MSKVKISELIELLNLLSCGGMIESLAVKSEDGNVSATAINDVSTLMSIVKFDIDVPDFCIGDVQKTLAMLGTMSSSDVVDVTTKKGKLIVKREKPKKTLQISTIKEKTVKTLKKVPKINGDVTITINTNSIKDITKDSKVVDLVEVPMMIIDGEFGTVVGDLNKIESSFSDAKIEFTDGESKDIFVKFAEEYISSVFRLLKGDVKIELGIDRPLKVTKETENYTVSYIIAPIIKNEEDYDEE